MLRRVAVDKSFASVENSKVVDEMHIASLGLDLKLDRLGDRLHHVKRLSLAVVELWEMFWPGVDGVSQQGCTSKVHDHLRLMIEQHWPALEMRPFIGMLARFICDVEYVNLQGKGPIRLRKGTYDIGTMSR